MKLYKLTDKYHRTYNKTLWGPNVTHTTSGKGDLCGPGWLHAYSDPLLAALFNPIHANVPEPVLWLSEGKPEKFDSVMKLGCRSLTTIRELPLPRLTLEYRVQFAIRCALEIYHEPSFEAWAWNWVSGKDRSPAAAESAESAAESAESAAWSAALSARSAALSARSAALSARSAALSARSAALSARSAALSALSARSAESARSAAESAESAAESAESAAESARSAAESAESAAESAESAAESAALSARSAESAESAAESAESAAESAETIPKIATEVAEELGIKFTLQ